MAAIATGVSAATSAARARMPGSTVTIVRSLADRHDHGLRRPLGAEARDRHAVALDLAAHVLAAQVVADRRDERRVEPEPRGRHRGDGAAARRAHQLAGEALLAGLGQRLEPDEREVEEGGGGDCEFDAKHGA